MLNLSTGPAATMAQRLTDADPLDLVIAPGVRVRDLKSRQDCDDALMRLTMEMESINAQISNAETDPSRVQPGWRSRAQSAIRWKKRIKAVIAKYAVRYDQPAPLQQLKRKVILDTFKDELGEAEFRRLVDLAKERNPEIFEIAESEAAK